MKTCKCIAVRLAAAALCGALLLPGLTASALAGFSKGRMWIVTEPEAMSDLVTYYKDGEEQDKAGLTWVDGRDGGKALLLDGKSEYLQVGSAQLRTNFFSFTAWINWQGAPVGEEETSRYNQRLFTYARRDERWLSFSPFARDTSKLAEDGGYLNGMYLEFNFDAAEGQPATRLEQFNGAQDGISYGLPENEWHHIAVVSNQQTMKVYVDGTLWFDDILIMSMVELRALTMKVGAGVGDEGYLHAILDDVALYETALSAEQVAIMAAGADPLEGETMPETTAPYIATQPSVSQADTSTQPAQQGGTSIFGLPVITVALVGGVLVVVIGLSVFLSIRHPGDRSGGKSEKKGGGRT